MIQRTMGNGTSMDHTPPRIELLHVHSLKTRADPGDKVTYVALPSATSAAPALVGLLLLLLAELVVIWVLARKPDPSR
jgi:hypothetical protein